MPNRGTWKPGMQEPVESESRALESVDYTNTFIAVAPDAQEAGVQASAPQPRAGKPTVASATFEMLHDAPYEHTSGDVIFEVWADRQGIPEPEREAARREYYAKGRPCMRASDLGKKFGWGVHADARGRLAVYPYGSTEYVALASGTAPDGTPVQVLRAMRTKR